MKNIFRYLPILFIALSSATLIKSKTPVQNISNANNEFAFELFEKINRQENGNIFLSPFSISTAIAMTYAGADGSTATEIMETMHFSDNKPEFHIAFGNYLDALVENANQNIELSIANKLWGEKRYKLMPSFVELNKIAYHSGLERVNFVERPDIARDEINDWVAAKTNEKILNLLPQGAITIDTRLVLTNAVYFKGDWLYKFDKKNTETKKFYLTPNQKVEVPFMKFEGTLNYAKSTDYQAVQLPYQGNKQSMIVVLPNDHDVIESVSSQINTNTFNQMLTAQKPLVDLELPKFKMTLPLNLNKCLKELGIKKAFSSEANFSKMTATNDLFVSDVIHKAFIEVNEKGTEAAAATAVVMTIESMAPSKPIKPIEFKVDHPFLIYIIDNDTKAILFMGRVMNPTGE